MKTAKIRKASYRRKYRHVEHQNSGQMWIGEHHEATPQSIIDPSPNPSHTHTHTHTHSDIQEDFQCPFISLALRILVQANVI